MDETTQKIDDIHALLLQIKQDIADALQGNVKNAPIDIVQTLADAQKSMADIQSALPQLNQDLADVKQRLAMLEQTAFQKVEALWHSLEQDAKQPVQMIKNDIEKIKSYFSSNGVSL